MTQHALIHLRVRALTWEAEDVLGIELVAEDPRASLPAFAAGAHLDLHLPGGLVRSYSLLNDAGERHRYCLAVHLDRAGRGGSRWIHERLRPGELLWAAAPRNNFPLVEDAQASVFIAGGIGITPILSMLRRLASLQRPWELHYSARTRDRAAYVDDIRELARATGNVAEIRFDHEPGGRPLDLQSLLGAMTASTHVYCCGPLGMLEAFARAADAVGIDAARRHVEYFASQEAAATGGGFTVHLARSRKVVPVQAGQTVLDALIAVGAEPPYSCRQGICGTCEVAVLDGTPDHRDLVLTPDEKAGNKRMMVCCSGSKTPTLTLDL